MYIYQKTKVDNNSVRIVCDHHDDPQTDIIDQN